MVVALPSHLAPPLSLHPNLLALEHQATFLLTLLQEPHQAMAEMYHKAEMDSKDLHHKTVRHLACFQQGGRGRSQKEPSLKTKPAVLFTMTKSSRMDTASIQEGFSLVNQSTGRTTQVLNSMHYNMEAFMATKGEGHISLSHLPSGVPERILRMRGTSNPIQTGAQTWRGPTFSTMCPCSLSKLTFSMIGTRS